MIFKRSRDIYRVIRGYPVLLLAMTFFGIMLKVYIAIFGLISLILFLAKQPVATFDIVALPITIAIVLINDILLNKF